MRHARLLEPDHSNLLGHLHCALEGRGRRKLRDRDYVLFVLRWDESARQGGKSQVRKYDQSPVNGERDAAAAHGVTDRARIRIARDFKTAVKALEEATEEAIDAA